MSVSSFDAARYKETTREQWQEAAAAWHRWGPFLERWLGEATDRMIDLAGIEAGSRVLYRDGGAGGQTIPAARRVGETGAGLATGGITAGLAASKKSDLNCAASGCLPSQRGDVDSHNQLLTISTVGFVAAGVGAATAGLFVLLSGKPKEQSARVTPVVGLGMAGVQGAF